jgi:WS/DGAT/MGAT family acyltransferase
VRTFNSSPDLPGKGDAGGPIAGPAHHREPTMQQLSGADDVSLFAERRNVHNHVGALLVYDVTTAPGGKVRFKDILRHFEDRLYLHPVFRRRLVPVPFGIDRPYWVAEPNLDVEYHIRHIALPEPGDWRQLMILVARLHSMPLDRAHPLWEAYVIEGLDNIPKLPPGAFAVFLKIHHAVVDGLAAVHLVKELHSPAPDDADEPPKERAVVADRDPSNYEFLANSIINNLSRTARLVRLSATLGGRALAAGREQLPALARGDVSELVSKAKGLLPDRAPVTRFSAKVSRNRVIEAFGLPISRIARVRAKVPGATLNDVFVAVAGGAVRKYLEGKGELPDESLTALMPISLRTDGSAGGNEVAGMPVRVRSDIEDPIERLLAVHGETRTSKARGEAMGLDLLKNVFDVLPPVAVNGLLDFVMLPGLNMAVSNVRGPDSAMYLAGAKAMCLYPVSIPADGAGLNLTGVSYNGVMWVSMVSCRDMVPDPGVFLACMRGAWDELLAAADALPDPSGAATPAGRPARGKRKTARRKTARPKARR